MKLEISLYKFDAKTDYLPYYTKHFVKIKEEKNLLDILKTIKSERNFGFEEKEDFAIVLNGLYTTLKTSVEAIKNDFGKDLTIEPISIKRSYKDLLINEDDFNDKLNLIEEYITDENKKEYESYKLDYYASNSLKYNENYVGDALILLVDSLIKKDDSNKDALLKIISNSETGIAFHTNLSNKIYQYNQENEEKISALKKSLHISKNVEEQNFKLNNKKTIDFDKMCGTSIIKHTFNDFNIAYYRGNKGCEKAQTLLENLEAKNLQLQSLNNDLAMDTFHKNQEFTYQLAAEMMLDAFDNDADFIVVDNESTFYLLDYNRKELGKASGRDILLPVLHINELSKLVCGLHDDVKKSLDLHTINPEII
ncbi:MAG: DUF5644 domain-containing protein [Candidatus Marinarcus sp.]|uniref:DUF5644 domain-containing protein n=1 Tax=Candidatus Marinarcus sp. TaxID=3100987 RepID=UPI003AFF7FB1